MIGVDGGRYRQVIARSPVASASLADFDVQHRCNVLAPFALTQLFLPMLIKRHGYIVFVNSTVGERARPAWPNILLPSTL